jgi:alpha-N-arabinofuranosidase
MPTMPTFGAWEATVLEHTYDHVDYISVHAYFTNDPDDRAGWLASGHAMDTFIDGIIATCDYVGATKRSRRKLQLSFDEWNVWHVGRTPATTTEWVPGPRLIEEEYTVEDAVVVGGLLISLLRHADRVGIAALAQLVNVIAPIRTEPDRGAWRQTTFVPFARAARHARGQVLLTQPRVATISTGSLGDVPAVDVVVTWDEEAQALTVFALNRHQHESIDLKLDLRAFGVPLDVVEQLVLGGEDLDAANTAESPERWAPRHDNTVRSTEAGIAVALPAVSWSLLRLAPRRLS